MRSEVGFDLRRVSAFGAKISSSMASGFTEGNGRGIDGSDPRVVARQGAASPKGDAPVAKASFARASAEDERALIAQLAEQVQRYSGVERELRPRLHELHAQLVARDAELARVTPELKRLRHEAARMRWERDTARRDSRLLSQQLQSVRRTRAWRVAMLWWRLRAAAKRSRGA
jgi:hypothetical protein